MFSRVHIRIFLTLIVIVLTSSGLNAQSCCQNKGDVNHSGGVSPVNISDLVYLVDYAFHGGPAPVCLDEADLDNSGGTNPSDINDIILLVEYLFLGGSTPSCNHPLIPNTVGSFWIYRQLDSLGAVIDTYYVSITDTMTILPDSLHGKVWDYSPGIPGHHLYGNQQYVYSADPTAENDSTIFFLQVGDGAYRTQILYTPLHVGDEWDCIYCFNNSDFTKVESIEPITVPAGEFIEAIKLTRYVQIGDESGSHITYWIVPGIGIVKMFESH